MTFSVLVQKTSCTVSPTVYHPRVIYSAGTNEKIDVWNDERSYHKETGLGGSYSREGFSYGTK